MQKVSLKCSSLEKDKIMKKDPITQDNKQSLPKKKGAMCYSPILISFHTHNDFTHDYLYFMRKLNQMLRS